MVPYEYRTFDNGIVFRGFQAKSLAWVKALACLTNGHSLSTAANKTQVGNEGTTTTFPNDKDEKLPQGLRKVTPVEEDVRPNLNGNQGGQTSNEAGTLYREVWEVPGYIQGRMSHFIPIGKHPLIFFSFDRVILLYSS
jgi:hypothetical protein